MTIKKIEIKNYKGIKEIKINLSSNKNQIQNELKMGRFKVFNDKNPVPGTSVLVGRNSIGKSTIVSAISLFADVLNGFIGKIILNNLVQKEVQKITNEKMLNGEDPFEINNMKLFNQERKKINDKMVNSIKERKGLYFSKYNLLYIEWFLEFHQKYSNNLQKDIEISMEFINKKGELIKSSLFIYKSGYILIEHENNVFEKQVINFFKSAILPDRFYKTGKSDFIFPQANVIKSANYYEVSEKDLNIAIYNMFSHLKEKNTVKLLKLCDEQIKEIKYVRGINGYISIKGIILENGSIIDINDLSNGTKKFITIAEAIIRVIKIADKNGCGLIIIDEIETNLHKELVQSIFLSLRFAFKNKNIQSIVTTHNVHFLSPEISNKQIFSIEKEENIHQVKKPSSFIKPHESLIKKYDHNLIVSYPDKELARNTMVDIFNDL